MRYIIAVELSNYFKAIAKTSSLETAKILQFSLEQLLPLKIIIVDTRGL